MNDLDSIERSYGSVAEYNRSKDEAEAERWWSSLPKSEQNWRTIESKYQNDMYSEIDEKLTIPATDNAKSIANDYKNKTASIDWQDYEQRRQGNTMLHEAMSSIAKSHGLSFGDKTPQPDKGQFYIQYEYIDGGQYHTKSSNPMDKDTFMNAYSDLYELDKGMTVKYRDTSGRDPDKWGRAQDMHYVSNSSLASMRSCDFKHWDVDDPEGDAIIKDTKAKYKAIVEKAKSDFEREHAAEIESERFQRGYEDDFYTNY